MPGGEPIAIEILFHGEARAEEPNDGRASGLYDLCRRVGDVQHGNLYSGFDGGRHFVHRIGAYDHAVCACGFERTCRGAQEASGRVPIACLLQLMHIVKIDAMEDDSCRMQSTKAFFDEFVDQPVVGNGGLPTHAADEAYGFHPTMMAKIAPSR